MHEIYYRCTQCAYRVCTKYCTRQYVLPEKFADRSYWDNYWNEPIIRMQQRNSWCEVCQTISPIECVGEDLWNHDPEDSPDVRLIVDRLRKRSSCCLRCGSKPTRIPESDQTNLIHTPCGGVLEAGFWIVGYCPVYIPHGHWYSPEGQLLKKGFYWDCGKGKIAKDYEFPLWIEPRDYRDDEWSWKEEDPNSRGG